MTNPARPSPPAPRRKAMRRAAAGLLLGCGLSALTGGAYAQEEAALAVVTVNGQPSTLNLVGSLVGQLPDDMRRQPLELYYDRLIDDIIDTRLAADAARASDLAGEPLLNELADRARDRVLAEAWVSREIGERITEEHLEKRYKAFVDDTDSRTEVHARHILVDSKEAAEAAIGRLEGGEDFADLAKELSTGPSGPNGGDLGYFPRGSMVPEFENASFQLEKGGHTAAPVQTQFGWHVIKVEDRRVAPAPSLDEMREQLVGRISLEEASSILLELRSKATIERLTYDEMREAEAELRGEGDGKDSR